MTDIFNLHFVFIQMNIFCVSFLILIHMWFIEKEENVALRKISY